MFSIILRRIQRILLPIKMVLLIAFIASLIYCFINTSPTLTTIVFVSIAIFFILAIVLNFRLSAGKSLLAALGVSFVVFLRAVNLLSAVNLALLALFLLLLGLYLQKR